MRYPTAKILVKDLCLRDFSLTMMTKLRSMIGVTLLPNQSTSPYAMRMMVKFLKMV